MNESFQQKEDSSRAETEEQEFKREKGMRKMERERKKKTSFLFFSILLWRRQFLDYFPLNLTAIFTSHFDSFAISSRVILLTWTHCAGNNHLQSFLQSETVSFSHWHERKFNGKRFWRFSLLPSTMQNEIVAKASWNQRPSICTAKTFDGNRLEFRRTAETGANQRINVNGSKQIIYIISKQSIEIYQERFAFASSALERFVISPWATQSRPNTSVTSSIIDRTIISKVILFHICVHAVHGGGETCWAGNLLWFLIQWLICYALMT